MTGNRFRKKLLTINCIFIQILYNFERLTLPNKSPPQAPLGSGFCTDPPPLKMTKIFGRGGGSVEKYGDGDFYKKKGGSIFYTLGNIT